MGSKLCPNVQCHYHKDTRSPWVKKGSIEEMQYQSHHG